MKRTVIFGDIHGCHHEWLDLINKIGPSQEDHLIAVGDLICKGPAARKTLELAFSLKNLTCLMGNHELRFISSWKKGIIPSGKPYDETAFLDMGERYADFMKSIAAWPFYIEEKNFVVVHAGIRPGIPLSLQTPADLTEIRWIDDRKTPWYDAYTENKPIIFGHWVREAPLIRSNAFGLDTGCVYGGFLTALILPEQRIVQVKARKAYYQRKL